jgi:hypothetical protein
LLKGFSNEWDRLHNSFVAGGFGAQPYSGRPQGLACYADGQFWNDQQTAEAGFMTRYAGTNRPDDIADLVSWASTAPSYRALGPDTIYNPVDQEGCGDREADVLIPEDSACRAFRSANVNGIPQSLAAAYAKLRFAYELGLITKSAYDECRGTVGFEVPGEGYHVYIGGEFRRSFGQNVEAIIGTDMQNGRYLFQLTANGTANVDGTNYPANLKLDLAVGEASLELDQVSWPRGGYILDQGGNSFLFEIPDAPALTYLASKGSVLVTAGTAEHIEGSVVVEETVRVQSGLYEAQSPPLVFRFLIEGAGN